MITPCPGTQKRRTRCLDGNHQQARSCNQPPGQPSTSRLGWRVQEKHITSRTRLERATLKETVPKHSETNAIIVRANRTILETGRTVLNVAGIPKGNWGKASDRAAYTKNRVPHKTLQGKVLVEIRIVGYTSSFGTYGSGPIPGKPSWLKPPLLSRKPRKMKQVPRKKQKGYKLQINKSKN